MVAAGRVGLARRVDQHVPINKKRIIVVV